MAKRSKKAKGPKFVGYFGPVIEALRALGGSARPAEVRNHVSEALSITEAEQEELLPSGVQTRFDNQVHWARFYLAKAGYIDSSRRGVWSLTKAAERLELTDHQWAYSLFKEVHGDFVDTDSKTGVEDSSEDDQDEVLAPEGETAERVDHRTKVLDVLQSLPPSGFERFCQLLLRESDFGEVTVTGRSNDGGIDGIGILQVNALVSFKVLFQCKRYKGQVTPSQVRDFRGAMQGRADKGIILTTGTFTKDARREAVRDGVPPIELVDADKLINMLENLQLGLKPIQTFSVDTDFFERFRKDGV